jgi:hypothetical protein
MDSILLSIKQMLGITNDYDYFDPVLIININSVFSILTQLGVGPEKGFSIEDENAVWSDYIQDDTNLEFVKSYVYLKTKLLFDPPLSSSVAESMNNMISELEWRINVSVENDKDGDT